MNEREFQNWVIECAQRFGWRVWHVPTPMRPIGQGMFVPDRRGAGLPDLFMLHEDPPRLIFAEVKDFTGELTEGQQEFLKLARGVAEAVYAPGEIVGADTTRVPRAIGVYVWRPGLERLIEATLRGKVMMA